MKKISLLITVVVVITSCNQPSKKSEEQKSDSTSAQTSEQLPPANPEKNCYFGDLHLHTTYSFDAYTFGVVTTPDQAYKYAMGETVPYFGVNEKRNVPLDFLAVTDHAEYIG